MNKVNENLKFIIFFTIYSFFLYAQTDKESAFLESSEIDALLNEVPSENDLSNSEVKDLNSLQEDKKLLNKLDSLESETSIIQEEEVADKDDLDLLKEDLGDLSFEGPKDDDLLIEAFEEQKENKETPVIFSEEKKEKQEEKIKIVNEGTPETNTALIFDVGQEEKKLLEMAKLISGKTSDNEWNEIASASNTSSYTVVEGDWLWKISERLFGSGFYYSKIWSLNPYITNPHLIEPGMTLVFTTGNSENMPDVQLGSFSNRDKNQFDNGLLSGGGALNYSEWGDGKAPDWFKQKNELVDQGVYVQYSTSNTIDDVEDISKKSLNQEYRKYSPPDENIEIKIPEEEYDSSGFDRNAKIDFPFKEGFYLNTFVSSNIVQDFGKIDSSPKEGVLLTAGDSIYLKFDSSINVLPGDKFSIYHAGGKVSHRNSERVGYKYTIVANVQIVAEKGSKWLAEIIESTGVATRGDRVTVYTPKIERISKTFNDQIIEGAIIGGYSDVQTTFSFGDVLYLDRGRADGVEIGNIFEVYDFKDRLTDKNITENPTYKTGEVTVINVTDNFATVLVTQSKMDFYMGDIAVTKTKEAALRAAKLKRMLKDKKENKIEMSDLEELDIELNVDEMTDELLKQADQIKFTQDELAELERQEREKSILKESEKDLRDLERLESEIEEAESLLNEAKADEDKKLENLNLEGVEQETKAKSEESLEDIEENMGRKYMDDNLIEKENPYGLTEFDIEEIDELMNAEKKYSPQQANPQKQ